MPCSVSFPASQDLVVFVPPFPSMPTRTLLLAALAMMFSALPSPAALPSAPAPNQERPSLLAESNLLAWCIVPYDQRERGPVERMAMLQRLGIRQYVWDWRQKHLAQLPEEIKAAQAAGINLRGVWLWIDEQNDRVGQLGPSNRAVLQAVEEAHQPMEFWVGFHANVFADLAQDQQVAKGVAWVSYLRDVTARVGGTVALYNHGDWFGQPQNQLAIIEAMADPRIGMVYNFHHELVQRDLFVRYLPRMLPYLRAVNLTGLPEGKVGPFPLGSGVDEARMLRLLVEAGYTGPLGILGHVEDADVETVLRENLEGFRRLAKPLQAR
jgi:sugar phosphate isomerase/epimerase